MQSADPQGGLSTGKKLGSEWGGSYSRKGSFEQNLGVKKEAAM